MMASEEKLRLFSPRLVAGELPASLHILDINDAPARIGVS